MKKVIFCVIALSLSMIFTAHAFASVSGGDDAMKDGKYRVAIKEYKAALEEAPAEAEVLAKLARAYDADGWYGKSAMSWEEYLEKHPSGAAANEAREQASKARRWVGVQQYQTGAPFDVAVSQLEKAINIDSKNIDAYYWLARIHFEYGNYVEAIVTLERALETDKDNSKVKWLLGVARGAKEHGGQAYKLYTKAYAEYQAGDLEGALKQYKKSAKANPDFLGARIWIARVLFEMEEYDESVAAWDRVLELDPEHERAKWFKSVAKKRAGKQ